jgi:hypothetical protein
VACIEVGNDIAYHMFVLPIWILCSWSDGGAIDEVWHNTFIIIPCSLDILGIIGQYRGRRVDGTQENTFFRKIFFEVLKVAIVRVTEEKDRVDDVATEEESFVCSDGGGYAAELRVTDKDSREEEGTVGVGLRGPREGRTVDA